MLLNDLVGLHIELTNLCTLKCPGCLRTQLIKKWPQHWHNHSLDLDVLAKFLDIDLQDKLITFCGNTGDSIYHPKFHDFVKYFKNHGAQLRIFTNGSYRNQQWWETTASYLDNRDTVIFSVDGLPENFTQYRINADWDSIQIGMQTCIQAPCKTVWKYIPFNYNEHNIADAERLSQEMGFDVFKIEKSNRFDERTGVDYQLISFMPANNQHIDARYQNQAAWKESKPGVDIDPVCNDKRSHYISADGFYSPCCFVSDYAFYYKTEFGKNKKMYNITDRTITGLFQQQELNDFYSNLNNHSVCQFSCPATQE
jgi:organic radical activating enzyme